MKKEILSTIVVFGVLIVFILSFQTDVSYMRGYAGQPIQFSEETVYRTIYFRSWEVDAENISVCAAGTHIQENSLHWTSIGHTPQKGDGVIVIELRLFWRFLGLRFIHGWGYTQKMEGLVSVCHVRCLGH